MRREVRISSWYMLLVAVLGFLIGCQSLRDLERFVRRHHGALCPVAARLTPPINLIDTGQRAW